KGAVAVSGLTCYSVVQAVEEAGCTPIYLDINKDDLHFGASQLEAACKKNKINAVVVQHMLGLPANIKAITEVAKKYNVTIIEDLAHAAGATYGGQRQLGTVAPYTVLSFGKDKALDVINGGALIVRSGKSVEALPYRHVRFGEQLRDRLYPFISLLTRSLWPVGGKYIMAVALKTGLVVRSADGEIDATEIMPAWQAKLALEQLDLLDTTVKHRQAIVGSYEKYLKVPIPKAALKTGASPIRLPLLVRNRDEIIETLGKSGYHALDIWYDTPVGPTRFYDRVAYPEKSCPVAVEVASSIINLPTHQRITKHDARRIASIVNKVAQYE
ncbi:MAG TPA: aminotransferase class I/II-fold pyridoxal phosphate-dependent enzyme, partial [Candidatus Saccharibacteria bacterium]|nr:aminotransferase class I/II-fold pyridoxal phosphate-dependent enzyme [Candidatus Saccharibacteria bacterium]